MRRIAIFLLYLLAILLICSLAACSTPPLLATLRNRQIPYYLFSLRRWDKISSNNSVEQ